MPIGTYAATNLHQTRDTAPLIVGRLNGKILDLDRQALAGLACESALRPVPGAKHPFEEPSTLDRVVAAARRWLLDYPGGPPAMRSDNGGT